VKQGARAQGERSAAELSRCARPAKSWNIISSVVCLLPGGGRGGEGPFPQSPWPTIAPHGRVKLLETRPYDPREIGFIRDGGGDRSLGEWLTHRSRAVTAVRKIEYYGMWITKAREVRRFRGDQRVTCGYVNIAARVISSPRYRFSRFSPAGPAPRTCILARARTISIIRLSLRYGTALRNWKWRFFFRRMRARARL